MKSTRQFGTVGQRSKTTRTDDPAAHLRNNSRSSSSAFASAAHACTSPRCARTRSCEVSRNPRVTPSRAPATKLRSFSGSSRLRSASLKQELIVASIFRKSWTTPPVISPNTESGGARPAKRSNADRSSISGRNRSSRSSLITTVCLPCLFPCGIIPLLNSPPDWVTWSLIRIRRNHALVYRLPALASIPISGLPSVSLASDEVPNAHHACANRGNISSNPRKTISTATYRIMRRPAYPIHLYLPNNRAM